MPQPLIEAEIDVVSTSKVNHAATADEMLSSAYHAAMAATVIACY